MVGGEGGGGCKKSSGDIGERIGCVVGLFCKKSSIVSFVFQSDIFWARRCDACYDIYTKIIIFKKLYIMLFHYDKSSLCNTRECLIPRTDMTITSMTYFGHHKMK